MNHDRLHAYLLHLETSPRRLVVTEDQALLNAASDPHRKGRYQGTVVSVDSQHRILTLRRSPNGSTRRFVVDYVLWYSLRSEVKPGQVLRGSRVGNCIRTLRGEGHPA
jgi:hypothetical protein